MAAEAGKAKYKRWAWPHPMVVFWLLNPATAINEVCLGQRLPRVTLIDETVDRPLMERMFVPCPGCGEMHDGRLWSWSNAFGHWFGYVCPSCGGSIPCLWSLTSLLVLAVTAPVWALPVLLWKERWLQFEKRRVVARLQKAPVGAAGVPWTKLGVLGVGGMTWLGMNFTPRLVPGVQGTEVDWPRVLGSLPFCMAGGYLWGRWMKHFMSKRPHVSSSAAK